MLRLSLKDRLFTTLLLVPLVAFAACSDDDEGDGTGTEDHLAALVGNYTTQSFTYTADADPSIVAPLAALGFGIQSLNVAADGSFTGDLAIPVEGETQQIALTGNLQNVTGSSMTVNFTGIAASFFDPLDVTYTITGDVLSFTAEDVDFDFTLSGQPEIPASLTVVLVRS